MRSTSAASIALFFLLAPGVSVFGETHFVSLDGTMDFTDIQAAIDAAEDGDEIIVRSGEYVIERPLRFNPPQSPEIKNLVVRGFAQPGEKIIRLAEDAEWTSVVEFVAGESERSVLEGFTISGGKSGGIVCSMSSPTLRNLTVTGNRGSGVGHWGIFASGSELYYPRLVNCLICGNRGPGLFCDGLIDSHAAAAKGDDPPDDMPRPMLMNCTLAGNLGPGVLSVWGARPELTNCIMWGNSGGSIEIVGPADCIASYSSIEGEDLWPGEGNIRDDPLFVEPGRWEDPGTPEDPDDDVWIPGDYHISSDSPCLDSGTPEGAPDVDIEYNSRPFGEGVDRGAYEWMEWVWPPSFRRGDANADGRIDISDGVISLMWLFSGVAAPRCMDAADADNSGRVNITDPIYVLMWLFLGGPAPPDPGPWECGLDPDADDLDCASFPPCE
ncbi:MAG: hypothetical protein JXA90_16130 [Planctomycetes bacterium]|nr:hypothetical protein [Planctomycetota bacterium]